MTFFTACFTLDQIRVENNRNALIPCIVHKTYERNKFSDRQYVRDMLNFFYSKIILTIPGKVKINNLNELMNAIFILMYFRYL